MRTIRQALPLVASLLVACAAPTDDAADAEGQSQESAWEAETVDHEESSTHLWIVNRGVEILGTHTRDAVARRVFTLMNEPLCRAQWQQGLYDADYKADYNNGLTDLPKNPSEAQVLLSGATWESHFYDPDTGKNYKGGTTRTALTEADKHMSRSLELGFGVNKREACYELGLALHYFTDLTQPMHASNFTALSRPAKLHVNLEGYAMELQDKYPLADWTGAPRTVPLKDFVRETAVQTKPLFQEGVTAIINAYNTYSGWHFLRCRKVDAQMIRFLERQYVDHRVCWQGNPGVDATVGKSLMFAQDRTAQYLYLLSKRIAN